MRICFLFFVFCCLAMGVKAQDTTAYRTDLWGELVNDSVAKLILHPVTDGYYGYFERKQSSTGNVWIQLAEIDTMRFEQPYLDTFYYNCKDTIAYRYIEHHSTFGDPNEICYSNTVQFVVGDVEIPDMPLNTVFSVDVNTQQLVFTYSQSVSEDVLGYVICKGNPCVALDTVWGKENTTYVCSTCNVEEVSQLAIMSFDSCYNTSLRSDKLNNIVLNVDRRDCSQILALDWNEYNNMPTGLRNYEVHLIADNSDNVVFTTANTYCDLDISAWRDNLEIYIKAVANSVYSANSNKIEITENAIDTLDYISIDNVSVDMDNHSISLEISLDNSKRVGYYSLYRAKDDGDFTKVKDMPYTGEDVLYVQDYIKEEILNTIYSYYLAAPDVCGNTFTKSKIVSTFKANVEEINAKTNRVTWSSCTLFPIERYEIYRYEQSDHVPELVGESVVNYFDDLHGGITSYADKLYYFVAAIQRTDNGNAHVSNSSHNYLKKESLFWMPNAFDPTEGVVTDIQTFKPKVSYIKKDSYDFKIFNRMGTLVFSTNNVEEGWNGTYKGKLCDVGVYAYKIQFKNSNGKLETHSGTFMLYD